MASGDRVNSYFGEFRKIQYQLDLKSGSFGRKMRFITVILSYGCARASQVGSGAKPQTKLIWVHFSLKI